MPRWLSVVVPGSVVSAPKIACLCRTGLHVIELRSARSESGRMGKQGELRRDI